MPRRPPNPPPRLSEASPIAGHSHLGILAGAFLRRHFGALPAVPDVYVNHKDHHSDDETNNQLQTYKRTWHHDPPRVIANTGVSVLQSPSVSHNGGMKKPSEDLAKLRAAHPDDDDYILMLRCQDCEGTSAWVEWVDFNSCCPDCGEDRAEVCTPKVDRAKPLY